MAVRFILTWSNLHKLDPDSIFVTKWTLAEIINLSSKNPHNFSAEHWSSLQGLSKNPPQLLRKALVLPPTVQSSSQNATFMFKMIHFVITAF